MRLLITIPGIHASQRFECLHDDPSPFVALHEIAGPEVFESDEYKAQAGPSGTGEWRSRMNSWRRNVFAGLDHTPEVPKTGLLLVIEDGIDSGWPDGVTPVWLMATGLDRSAQRRALAVCHDSERGRTAMDWPGIRVLKPLTPRLTAA